MGQSICNIDGSVLACGVDATLRELAALHPWSGHTRLWPGTVFGRVALVMGACRACDSNAPGGAFQIHNAEPLCAFTGLCTRNGASTMIASIPHAPPAAQRRALLDVTLCPHVPAHNRAAPALSRETPFQESSTSSGASVLHIAMWEA